MPRFGEHAEDRRWRLVPQDYPRYMFLGTVLQFVLRIVLIVFVVAT